MEWGMAYKSYFRGKKANKGWQALESDEAKRLRGHGWTLFRKRVLDKRGYFCEVCGVENTAKKLDGLHLHHKLKIRMHRHLRFEESNVVACCHNCHRELEKSAV